MASHTKHELLTIPVEMFVRIAWQTPQEGLAALRLTCKYAAKNMSKVFAQVHFDEKAVLLSNVSELIHAQSFVMGPDEPTCRFDWISADRTLCFPLSLATTAVKPNTVGPYRHQRCVSH